MGGEQGGDRRRHQRRGEDLPARKARVSRVGDQRRRIRRRHGENLHSSPRWMIQRRRTVMGYLPLVKEKKVNTPLYTVIAPKSDI